MKYLIMLFTFCLLSNAYAFDPVVMMKQEMEASARRACNDKQFLSCIGRSSKKCLSAANKAMAHCEKLFPTSNAAMGDGNAFFAHASCMDKNITKNLGVSQDKLNQCDPEAAGDPAGGIPPM